MSIHPGNTGFIATRTVKNVLLAACFAVLTSVAHADLAPGFDAAMSAADRPAEDKQRDASRKPAEVLEFLGIGEGMRVLDALAGGGWYSEVLAAAVGPEGKVIAQNTLRGKQRSGATIEARAARLKNIEPLFEDFDDLSVGPPVDAALTALNLHDMHNHGAETGQVFLRAIFDALKPGGVFGVIDHVGVGDQDNLALHRIELPVAIDAIEQAGFIVEETADILSNPADDHTLNIHDEALGRNTDRFVIRARKPQ
ncbi:MAG TPA: hypothetical protein PKK10_02620 [Woeseiaceae bacterium]|nr:hypothetical protein [Woeseiaceae bacterium]